MHYKKKSTFSRCCYEIESWTLKKKVINWTHLGCGHIEGVKIKLDKYVNKWIGTEKNEKENKEAVISEPRDEGR